MVDVFKVPSCHAHTPPPLDLSCKRHEEEEDEEWKSVKRKEQNKVAALFYRKRQKSLSFVIENEYEELKAKNGDLIAYKDKLEKQIELIRELLKKVAKKRQDEEDNYSDTMSEPAMASSNNDHHVLVKRARKYSWPSYLTGKERKKEQNKLASRRFRERRKMHKVDAEKEAETLEATNKMLRLKCQELERKVQLLKDLARKRDSESSAM